MEGTRWTRPDTKGAKVRDDVSMKLQAIMKTKVVSSFLPDRVSNVHLELQLRVTIRKGTSEQTCYNHTFRYITQPRHTVLKHLSAKHLRVLCATEAITF